MPLRRRSTLSGTAQIGSRASASNGVTCVNGRDQPPFVGAGFWRAVVGGTMPFNRK